MRGRGCGLRPSLVLLQPYQRRAPQRWREPNNPRVPQDWREPLVERAPPKQRAAIIGASTKEGARAIATALYHMRCAAADCGRLSFCYRRFGAARQPPLRRVPCEGRDCGTRVRASRQMNERHTPGAQPYLQRAPRCMRAANSQERHECHVNGAPEPQAQTRARAESKCASQQVCERQCRGASRMPDENQTTCAPAKVLASTIPTARAIY